MTRFYNFPYSVLLQSVLHIGYIKCPVCIASKHSDFKNVWKIVYLVARLNRCPYFYVSPKEKERRKNIAHNILLCTTLRIPGV